MNVLNTYASITMSEVRFMPYCPRCGNEVDENMTFCPRCGASLKMKTEMPPAAPTTAPSAPQPPMRNEKQEKQEKGQRNEKGEKHEKGEFGYVGFLIAGLIVVILGVFAFLQVSNVFTSGMQNALTLLVIGLAIIIVGVYVATMARRRNPHPSGS